MSEVRIPPVQLLAAAQAMWAHPNPEGSHPQAIRQAGIAAGAQQPTLSHGAHAPAHLHLQPTLQMADARQPYGDGAKGRLYAAFNTDGSFGVFNEWSCVTGQRFKKYEYSPRAPASSGKYKSWADARAAALDWLLAAGSTPQCRSIRLVQDAEPAVEQRADADRAAEQQATPER